VSLVEFAYRSALVVAVIAGTGLIGAAFWGSMEWLANGFPRLRDRVTVAVLVPIVLAAGWTVMIVNMKL
jgi:hypothetical protein